MVRLGNGWDPAKESTVNRLGVSSASPAWTPNYSYNSFVAWPIPLPLVLVQGSLFLSRTCFTLLISTFPSSSNSSRFDSNEDDQPRNMILIVHSTQSNYYIFVNISKGDPMICSRSFDWSNCGDGWYKKQRNRTFMSVNETVSNVD